MRHCKGLRAYPSLTKKARVSTLKCAGIQLQTGFRDRPKFLGGKETERLIMRNLLPYASRRILAQREHQHDRCLTLGFDYAGLNKGALNQFEKYSFLLSYKCSWKNGVPRRLTGKQDEHGVKHHKQLYRKLRVSCATPDFQGELSISQHERKTYDEIMQEPPADSTVLQTSQWRRRQQEFIRAHATHPPPTREVGRPNDLSFVERCAQLLVCPKNKPHWKVANNEKR
jgi:hypothetical protein